MKRLTIILTVLVSLLSISLSANERVELPTKSISLILEDGSLDSKSIISIVQLVNPVDSTQNQGDAHIALGVVETIGGCGILYAGIAGIGAGIVVHLFRPEDQREWIALYSLGTAGTALGLFLIDDGMKRIGFKGFFRSKTSAKPGIYYSE
jgi:hypothetical protein